MITQELRRHEKEDETTTTTKKRYISGTRGIEKMFAISGEEKDFC